MVPLVRRPEIAEAQKRRTNIFPKLGTQLGWEGEGQPREMLDGPGRAKDLRQAQASLGACWPGEPAELRGCR